MTAAVNPAQVGRAAELAVRAVDDLMTWEAQTPRTDLTVEDVNRIARLLRQAATELDGRASSARFSAHGYELTEAGLAATDDPARRRRWAEIVCLDGGRS
ncbi:hypothetical protein [Pseudonocardia sp. NPDC049635]|uniref:hypothetical protein n=1 Tax=Pseudonocardia sp. NPDC049635 TaxID=3155506 RepID=UPI0033F5E0B8